MSGYIGKNSPRERRTFFSQQREQQAASEGLAGAVGRLDAVEASVAQQPTVAVFSVGGSFTKASYPWAKRIKVRLQGGGGGGGGAGTTAAAQGAVGGGGGAGAYAEVWLDVASLAASETVTVGVGGVGGTGAVNGVDGGDTVAFGVTCPGGVLGRGGAGTTHQYLAALPGGQSTSPTGPFDYGTRGSSGVQGIGTQERNCGGTGGGSVLGAGGSPGNAITAVGSDGGDGEFGGGGGGGANRPSQGSTRTGGSGGGGVVIVEVYA